MTTVMENSIMAMENCFQDEEVNCVFCGKLFPSVEKVQEHISQSHEAVEIPSENLEIKTEPVLENKQLRVYDLNTELIVNKIIDYNSVVQCSKCDLLFVNVYASRIHFEKMHLGRKRRRSNNPNGVKKLIAESKFREILPSSKRSKIDKCVNEADAASRCELQTTRGGHDRGEDDEEDEESLPGSGRPAANLWRAAPATSSSSRGNKIVISRVYHQQQHQKQQQQQQQQQIDNDTVLLVPPVSRTKYGFLQKSGYSCFYCGEIFLNKENFKRHLLLHRMNKSYKCRNCGSRFPRVKMLKQHQRNNCHIEFISSSVSPEINGMLNVKVETNRILPKKIERELCHDVKVEKVTAKTPVAQHREDEVSPRDIKFAEKFLNNSSITLNKGSQCVCNLCQSCFYSNNSILRHLVLYHRIAAQDGSTALKSNPIPSSSSLKSKTNLGDPNSEPCNPSLKPTLHFIHNCDICGSQFASKKGLQRHLYSVHLIQTFDPSSSNNSGSGTRFKGATASTYQLELLCPECNLTFGDMASFEAHKNECMIGSSIRCDSCQRRFITSSALDEHNKLYEGGSCVGDPGLEGGTLGKMGAAAGGPGAGNLFIVMDQSGSGRFSTMTTIKTESSVEKGKHRGSFGGGAGLGGGGGKKLSYTIPAYKKAKVPPNAEGLFECDVCHKTFTCRSSLSNHVKSHFNFKNKPFSCSSCSQGFMSTLTLQHHREQLCPNLNNNNGNNNNNNNNNNGNNNSNSDANNSGIGSVDSTPQNSGPTAVTLFCNFDGISQIPGTNYSANDGDRGTHFVGNNNLTTRATSCMHCSAMFPDRSLLEDHASKEHSNNAGEVVCIICPRSFTTYMAFRVHMTKSHGGPNGTSLKSHLNTTNSLLKTTVGAPGGGPGTTTTGFELIQELATSLGNEFPRGGAVTTTPTLVVPSHSPNGGGAKMYHSRHSCPNCDKDFSTSQALGNHKRACMPHLYKKVSL